MISGAISQCVIPTASPGSCSLDAGYEDPHLDPAIPYDAYVESNERKAPIEDATVEPRIVAAVEHGMAHAPPSATRGAIAAGDLPVLLVAAGEASEAQLERFASDVPQADIHRLEGAGHDVLADGGRHVAPLLVDWLR